MKRFKDFFISFCLAVFVSLTAHAQAPSGPDSIRPTAGDSITVSLLTCSPGNQVWSLYGHTAIRFRDAASGMDLAVNYGMFNFGQKNFVPRFVFGLTDYEMGIEPFQLFLLEYARSGRGVVEQRLNLTGTEKEAIAQAIYRNYEPANRVYRYNYFYDNCTTRARDMLTTHLEGQVEYAVNPDIDPSYRELIHQWNADHRWARFGNDLLLGVKADAPTDRRQQQFLPDTLRCDFAHAVIVAPDGKRRPLVDSTFMVLQPNAANTHVEHDIWDTIHPRTVFAVLAIATLLLAVVELKRRKPFWLADVTLLTLDALAGLVLLAMVFSQHPTVSANLQILVLNPLSAIFVYPTVNRQLKGRCHWYWKVLLVCAALCLIGNIFQDYAEGMNLLALTLIVRCAVNIRTLDK